MTVLGAVGAIAAFHVVDHRFIPESWHVICHPLAGAAAVALAKSAGLTWDELGLATETIPAGLKVGATHGAGALVLVAAGSTIPRVAPLLEDARLEETIDGSLTFPTLVEIPLSTALYEELVFRSALLGLLTHRIGRAGGAIAASLLFGLWHVLPSLEDRKHKPAHAGRHPVQTVLPTVIGTSLAGAWFTWLRQRSGSVLAPMMVHAATNSGGLAGATLITRRRRRRRPGGDAARRPAAVP